MHPSRIYRGLHSYYEHLKGKCGSKFIINLFCSLIHSTLPTTLCELGKISNRVSIVYPTMLVRINDAGFTALKLQALMAVNF
jgi:hypothetical protein